jgi:hypothetical protein
MEFCALPFFAATSTKSKVEKYFVWRFNAKKCKQVCRAFKIGRRTVTQATV